MNNLPQNENIADAESLQGYRYLVWMEFEAWWKEKNPVRRANLALSLAEYTATLARLEVAELQQAESSPTESPKVA
jgi:hypothetical protein